MKHWQDIIVRFAAVYMIFLASCCNKNQNDQLATSGGSIPEESAQGQAQDEVTEIVLSDDNVSIEKTDLPPRQATREEQRQLIELKELIASKLESCDNDAEKFKALYPEITSQYPPGLLEENLKIGIERYHLFINGYHDLVTANYDRDKLYREHPEYQGRFSFDYIADLNGDGIMELISVYAEGGTPEAEGMTVILEFAIKDKRMRYRDDVISFGSHALVKAFIADAIDKKAKYTYARSIREVYIRDKLDRRHVDHIEYKSTIIGFDGSAMQRIADVHECRKKYTDCSICRDIIREGGNYDLPSFDDNGENKAERK